MNRDALVAQLVLHEGLRLKPYTDTVGKMTIGVGRNLTDVGLTEGEVYFLLANDIDACIVDLMTFPWFEGLGDVRQRVLVDMRFNLGPAGLRSFKNTLASIAAGHYTKAAANMRASKWAKQVGKRATRLALMMEKGV